MNSPIDQPNRRAPEPAYLIVNADDYAYFTCVSRGILDCARQGSVTATGVFANSPFLEEHAGWLAAEPDVDVGVHLNLTDRSPLTPGLSNALAPWKGRFPGKFPVARAILAGRIPVDLVRAEWRAQIERCLAAGLHLRFLNAHEHMHMLPPLYPVAIALAREYGIEHVRLATPEWPRIWSAGALLRDSIMAVLAQVDRLGTANAAPVFLGMGESGRLSSQYLSMALPTLKPGRIYELMCHPGFFDAAEIGDKRLLAYHDWEREYRTLSDPALPALRASHNVRLIGYRHLRKTDGSLHPLELRQAAEM